MFQPETVYFVGPTGTGKSDVAAELALKHGAEIVSADSMQVYRGMDIVTAKPGQILQKKVPHHLIDIVSISEPFDVARYVSFAQKTISEIKKSGKHVFVAGGTGMYVRALADGIFTGPGKDADLVLMDDDFTVHLTLCRGTAGARIQNSE